MSWVLIIEETQEILSQITTAVTTVDPKAEIVSFSNSHEFLSWMTRVQEHDPELDPPLPADRFLGLVTSIASWKYKDVKLIGKFKALFVQRGFAKSEDELFVIFTGYDSPTFQIKRYEHRSVNNVLFKPFDPLILQLTIGTALEGAKPLSNKLTHTHKANAEIEMLKEIRATAISELGFRTIANQQVQIGAIAKYYADFLETKQHRSALAQVLVAVPTEDPSLSSVELRFFALDKTQSFNVQKLAQKENVRRTLAGTPAGSEKFEFIFVEHEGSPHVADVRPTLERFYDHAMTTVGSLDALALHLNQATTESEAKRFVFIDHALLAGDESGEVDRLRSLHTDKNILIYVLSSKIFDEPLELALSKTCEDVYYAPFNRSYIMKGLKLKWPELRTKEELYQHEHEVDQMIHVSNPVRLLEVSEAGLVIDYHREIQLGSFREFHFSMPDELEVPPMVAQCVFTKPATEKNHFDCHFAFFGMRDHELKFIRRWMLNQYVSEKQKSDEGT